MEVARFEKGKTLNAISAAFPCRLHCAQDESFALSTDRSHYYGFVLEGSALLCREGHEPLPLSQGMYFSCPAPARVVCGGKTVLWERLGYQGLFELGGPVESSGRLRYIDGCTTTILASPPKVLDPVLNLLCFPPQTKQTMHFHPTTRLGVVFSGRGQCITPDGAPLDLEPGTVFNLEENLHHCFHTGERPMSLIAFHPDSDTGPTDESHPMLNRTYRLP